MTIDRYGIYLVSLDPTLGSEIAKTRPAVVVSDNDMNQHLGTVVICPVTSRLHTHWPSRVQTSVAGRPAEIAVDQIRAIAKARLGQKIDGLDQATSAAVRHVITLMYGVLSVA